MIIATGTTPMLFSGLADHFGLVGERYKQRLRLLSRFENEVTAVWQRRWSFNFIDAAGHRFLLYTDTEPTTRDDVSLECNTDYTVSFTVKAHIRDAQRTTRIERCSFRL